MEEYEAVVVGAGVGGLAAASLLAKEGLKTLLVEAEDRVGGRALSLRGEELREKGPGWYRRLLAGQYCWLAHAVPSLEEMAASGTLEGFTLDLGYHGVSLAGEGYFALLRDLIGGYGEHPVLIKPFLTGSWLDGEFYREPPLSRSTEVDEKLQAELDRLGAHYLEFFGDFLSMTPQEFEELDRVSLNGHLEKIGFHRSKALYDYFRCVGTLITTINNPHEISIGDILRYAARVIAPAILRGGDVYVGGFVEGGVMNWPEAVAARFRDFGGELRLSTRVISVELEGRRVRGVVMRDGGGEERVSCRRLVFNPPVQELVRYLDERALPDAFVRRITSLYGYGSVNPYIGLRELPVPEEHARRLMKTPCVVPRSQGFDWDVYMAWNIQSYIDPACAPAGRHLFAAYLPLTEAEAKNRETVMKVVRAVPDFLEEVYPGFKDCVEWELYTVCTRLEGVAKSVTQAGSLKPDVVVPGVEGLYLAGDTARGYGVAMDCACSSGILCASAITGRDYGMDTTA
ncbi:MAG: FAD-dependent oxidoreductase [Actinobacteria bacterium]|nr:FAD-dependent oxidoreductase [Actinomycetota bacterium]